MRCRKSVAVRAWRWAISSRKSEGKSGEGGRTSAIRVYAFAYFREAATEEGHKAAGHGTFEPA